MDPLETFILILASVITLAIWAASGTFGMHRLYYRDNPWPGLIRLSLAGGLLWIGVVILVWADESVRGIYVPFYLGLGYFAMKLFGQAGGSIVGLHYRVDVVERRNGAVAQVLAAFILATGLIFGGSLWGDADPVGDDEGGWWIVWAFFLLGWMALLIAFRIYVAREKGRRPGPRLPGRKSAQPRRVPFTHGVDDPRPAAFFLIASGVTLTDAVSGDFWGWRHGLLTFGVLAALLVVHEISASIVARREGRTTMASTAAAIGVRGVQPSAYRSGFRRIEGLLYLALAVGALALNRWLDLVLATG
jgi:hypothetical protein